MIGVFNEGRILIKLSIKFCGIPTYFAWRDFYNSVLFNRILKCDSESISVPGRQAGHTRVDRVTGRRSRSSAMS